MPYAGPSSPRLGDAAGTLRLLAYLAMAIVLMVLDHRGGWLRGLREQAGVVAEPVREIASWPVRAAGGVSDSVGTVTQLARQNRQLRRELLIAQARMARMTTVAVDNARLRTLLDAAQRGGLDVQLAPILDVDLDPTRQRLVLDAGRGDGVRVGQSVIDAHGLLGQVTHVGPLQSDVLLLTDPDHAVPVAIARNGVRLVAYGTGRSDRLALASIPLSSDVKVGDVIVTSGMGARFPPGFPVGRVVALEPDDTRAFLRGDVEPAAQLDRGREVLLLRSAPPRPPVAIQAPTPAGPVGEGLPSAAGTGGADAMPATGSGAGNAGSPVAGTAAPATGAPRASAPVTGAAANATPRDAAASTAAPVDARRQPSSGPPRAATPPAPSTPAPGGTR